VSHSYEQTVRRGDNSPSREANREPAFFLACSSQSRLRVPPHSHARGEPHARDPSRSPAFAPRRAQEPPGLRRGHARSRRPRASETQETRPDRGGYRFGPSPLSARVSRGTPPARGSQHRTRARARSAAAIPRLGTPCAPSVSHRPNLNDRDPVRNHRRALSSLTFHTRTLSVCPLRRKTDTP
jgi:hypothetical protein